MTASARWARSSLADRQRQSAGAWPDACGCPASALPRSARRRHGSWWPSLTRHRAVEVRGRARLIEQDVSETALRIVTWYEGPGDGAAGVEALRGADVIIRVEPGDIRVWGYADEFSAG